MKIATYKDGSRDGQLVVVSRDLTMAHYATGIAGRLQQVLDDWNFLSPQLQELSQTLNHGKARHAFAFDPRSCMAPLPRAYLFASAAPAQPSSSRQIGGIQVRRSDALRGPCDPVPATRSDETIPAGAPPGCNAGAELVVITGDLAADGAPGDSLAAVRLVTACAIWHHASAEAGEDHSGSASFCPVAVTTDELGSPWHQDLHRLQLQMVIDGRPVPIDEAWQITTRDIGLSLARCAVRLGLRAGSLIGTGVQASATLRCAGGAQKLRVSAGGPDGENLFGAISATIDAPH